MMNRRQFIETGSWLLSGAFISPFVTSCAPCSISFGWVTDIHYALAKVKWDRYFSESKEKLSEAILLFNELGLDFAIETGDFKDENEIPDKQKTLQYLRDIESVFARFKGPRYHVLGNHDVDSLSKQEFQREVTNTDIPHEQTYYTFSRNGWTFVVLDACFRSDGVAYDNNNFEWYDTAVSKTQLLWLKKVLDESQQPVCVFIHQPLDGEGNIYVNNALEVRQILEESKKVCAVFQGHKHEGGYSEINGIHYITQKAMVDYSGMSNSSYSLVEISKDGNIHIKAYRRAESRVLTVNELNRV